LLAFKEWIFFGDFIISVGIVVPSLTSWSLFMNYIWGPSMNCGIIADQLGPFYVLYAASLVTSWGPSINCGIISGQLGPFYVL
jgi:hypothetical protein